MRSPAHEPAPDQDLGWDLAPGDAHYRAFVGPPHDYDLVAAMSFGLLVALGLRQQHRVLDIGCGSLRVGRLLLPYLNQGGYTGLEPHAWLIDDGIRREVGQDLVTIKRPRFVHADTAEELVDEGARFDYLLAQSIFSHCGPDLLDSWVGQASRLLADDGAMVATFIPGDVDNDVPGWIYPDCVSYRSERLSEIGAKHGLDTVMLDWRHPRQQWVLFAKPGFGAQALVSTGLGWNQAFDRFNARIER
jgi:cyclopropane fatty-acyl-phospholipid synthase-like methyltransferase